MQMPFTVQQLDTEYHGFPDWSTYAVRSGENYCLALVGTVDRAVAPEAKRLAEMFAAAPEMLAALKSMEQVFDLYGEGIFKGITANTIRAAIAKAEARTR